MNWYIAALKNYVGFDGRAHRTEFWMFTLFNFLFSLAAMIVDSVLGLQGRVFGVCGPIQVLYGLAVFLPSLALAVRRLHDTGRSGWFVLIALIPIIGGIWLLVLMCLDSQPDPVVANTPFAQTIEILQKEYGTDYAYRFSGENSAIYIYRDLKKIGLVESMNAKIYDIGSIRGHRCSLIDPNVHTFGIGTVDPGTASGFGTALGAAFLRARMNKQAKIDAQQKTGLFITVKDVDHPEWRIAMYDKNDQARWHEILTQLFEGTLEK